MQDAAVTHPVQVCVYRYLRGRLEISEVWHV